MPTYVSDEQFDKAAEALKPFAQLLIKDAANNPEVLAVFSILFESYHVDIWGNFLVGDLILASVTKRRNDKYAQKVKETLSGYLNTCNKGMENFLRHLLFVEMGDKMDWEKVGSLLKTHFPELHGKI